MKIEIAEERGVINIPLSEVVKEGGELDIFPNVKNYFSVDYKPKNDRLALVAGGHIGFIPINRHLAVEIKPKFSISNLTRIVSIAQDKFNTLSFFNRRYREAESTSMVVFEFIASCLENELRSLEMDGLLKLYINRQEEAQSLRGRVNINRSMRQLWSRGKFSKAAIDFYEMTPDSHFNRLIKLAIKYCIDELEYGGARHLTLRRSLIRYYSLFDSVKLMSGRHELEHVYRCISEGRVPGIRSYYIDLCEVCRLILDRKGVSFDEIGSDVKLRSFTLDMATTFESYLINSLRLKKAEFSGAIKILDGNKEGMKKLYNQPSQSPSDAKPDIIIDLGDGGKIIADAKYKAKIKEDDRYQIISHALSYGAKSAVVISPKEESYSGIRLKTLGSIGSDHLITVYEYKYDLASNDLEAEELSLAQAIAGLA